MDAPKTPNEWWGLLDQHWPNIIEIFSKVGAPLDDICWSDGPGQEPTFHDHTLIATLETAKRDRDHATMTRFLDLCWMAAPDSSHIHSWMSWDVLCDLCSERWVFDPEQAA